jgi:hypothetical protein
MILDRSLEDGTYCYRKDHSSLMILERQADGEYVQNKCRFSVKPRSFNARLFRVIRFITDLETLHLLECNLTLTEDLPQLFRSCPKLTELHVRLSDPEGVERERLTQMNEDVKNELRSGFQRLVELHWVSYSCPVILEIFT